MRLFARHLAVFCQCMIPAPAMGYSGKRFQKSYIFQAFYMSSFTLPLFSVSIFVFISISNSNTFPAYFLEMFAHEQTFSLHKTNDTALTYGYVCVCLQNVCVNFPAIRSTLWLPCQYLFYFLWATVVIKETECERLNNCKCVYVCIVLDARIFGKITIFIT